MSTQPKESKSVIAFFLGVTAVSSYLTYIDFIKPIQDANAGVAEVSISFKGCFVTSAFDMLSLCMLSMVIAPGIWKDEKLRGKLSGAACILAVALIFGSYYILQGYLASKGYHD